MGADSWLGVDSCVGVDSSLVGADSWVGADSDAASWVGVDSRLACGASAGGCTELDEPEEPEELDELEEPEELEGREEPFAEEGCLVVVALGVEDLAELEPGKALAATSDSTAVSATLPAISHRLTRCSRRSATSRVCA